MPLWPFFFFFFFFLLFTFWEKSLCPPPTLFGAELRHWISYSVLFGLQLIQKYQIRQHLLIRTSIYTLLRTRPNGIAICPVFLFRLCPGCPGFDTGFILKINQNVHLFIFSTISELFNVYWYFWKHKMRGQSDNKTFRIHLKYTEIVPTLSWDALALAKYFRSFSRLKSIKI